jgi:GNAT superfamily N-acetyltransferase
MKIGGAGANMIEVRKARDYDIEALCDLYRDFHEFHVIRVPDRLASLRDGWPAERAALESRLRDLIAASDATLFVAEENSDILGFAEVYVRDDKPVPARVPRRHGHLQSMFVVSSRRGAGIGKALLAECEEWARSNGGEEMRLDVWEFPGGPLGFYELSGYRTIRRSLVRDLK